MTTSTRRRLSFHEQRNLRSRAPPTRPFTKKEGLPSPPLPAAVATSKILPSKVLPSNYPSNAPRRRHPAVDHEPNQPPPPPPPPPKKPNGSITEPTKENGTSSSSSLGLLQMDGWNSLSLGVLLNQTLVKAFPIDNVNVGGAAATSTTTRSRNKRSRTQRTTRTNHHPQPPCQYYRGTIVSYWVPPIYEYEPRLVGSITHTPHDYGLYHVCFDDGDQCDMDPNEAYECIELYHTQQQQQQQPQPRNHPHTPPQETTTTTNNKYRSQRTTMILNVERLLFYHHFEEYFKSQGLASVKAWAIQIGWNFDFEQTLLLSAIQTLVTHDTTITTTTNAAANQIQSCQENNDNPDDDGILVGKNGNDTTTHMGSSLTGNTLAVYSKGSSSSTTVLQKRKFAIPASSTNWVHPTSSHVLYATKTRCSARRTTHANSKTGHSLSLDTLLPTRVLTLPYHEDPAATVSSPLATNHNQHTITLTVAPSYIPNAGRGLFLTYEGPCEEWTTPGHVDIGKYAPHQPSDIKGQIVMEVKNFVFRNEPSEWSFDGPPPRRTTTSSSTTDKQHQKEPHVLYGNPVDPHALFDITSDETGQVHGGARRTLLPFVNEIMTTKKKRRTHLHTREAHQQRLDIQNVDAVHHDDGTLHYLLRAGAVFRRSEQTELLLYYGSEYNDVRHRKYVSHSTTRAIEEGNSVESVLCDGNEDISTLTTSEDPSEVTTTIAKCKALGPNASKDAAEPQKATTTRCATKQGMCYLTMYSTITTYTEQNLHQVLDFFLATPPIPSLARKRMVWVVEQAASYASQVLYQSNGTIPRDISDKISNVLKLFPRNSRARVDTESSHQDNDFELHKWHALLGCFVRKEIEGHGYCIGIVEEIIAPPAAAALGRTPIQKGAKVRTIRACDVRYRVTFPRFEQDIVMKESEAKKYLFNHKYPCFLLS